tara:strand:- start:165689 stop:167749 length:2061 start_codon:yes stop_codon:yes gene_type:complete
MLIDLNRNDFYWIGLKKFIKQYLLLILLFLIGRVVFTLYFAPKGILLENILDVFYAFFMGWRYDSIIISYFGLPYILLNIIFSLFKSRQVYKYFNFISAIYFFLVTLCILTFIVCDLGFYSFFQDHLNILFFGLLEDDTSAIFASIWKNYPVIWLSIPIILFLLGIFFFIKRNFKSIAYNERGVFTPGAFKYLLLINGTFILLFGGLRGGYSWYVLAPKYSDFSKHQFINQIALNGFITFEKAVQLRMKRNKANFKMYKELGYKKISDAFRDYLNQPINSDEPKELIEKLVRTTPENPELLENPPHVVMILAESFGGFWLKYQSETFDFLGPLQEHFNEDYLFRNFLSANNGTIGSLVSLQSTTPERPGQRYLSESQYMLTPLSSSINIPFSENGYETTFIYGGKLAWRDIGKYFKVQKYDHVIGENYLIEELKLTDNYGTEWGMYDEYLFRYIKERISKATKPQFIFVLTTSNHPPFQYPSSFKVDEFQIPNELDQRINRERELFSERFKAFKYANTVFADFISWFKGSELKDKVVFGLTGDHNFFGFLNYNESEKLTMHSVPFYLYLPERLRPESYDPEKLGSHEDIFATIYPRVLSNAKYTTFGVDLFSDEKSFALNSKIFASDEGMYYGETAYVWDSMPKTKKMKDQEFPLILRHKRSILSVVSYYLNYMEKFPYSMPKVKE